MGGVEAGAVCPVMLRLARRQAQHGAGRCTCVELSSPILPLRLSAPRAAHAGKRRHAPVLTGQTLVALREVLGDLMRALNPARCANCKAISPAIRKQGVKLFQVGGLLG